MNNQNLLTQFDRWLANDSSDAALVMRQWFEPIEGPDAVIFPPTYAIDKADRDRRKSPYNIDRFEDGTNVCQIDSVGSQANRMEPIFNAEIYEHLVPRIVIEANSIAGKKTIIEFLEAGHRAADAIVRFSELGPELHAAFADYSENGNAEPLARIAPTSIVFGSWDSRATQAKLPRIVRSVIRAYNIKELTRSAQYSTIAGNILEGGDAEVTNEGPKAELGLAHVPATFTHGGVLVNGEIRRDVVVKIETIRSLASTSEESTRKLQRYILGLALVSASAPPRTFLREGCELVLAAKPPEWNCVTFEGRRETTMMDHREVLEYAKASAVDFGVTQQGRVVRFDAALAKSVLGLTKDQRKLLLRQGPVTKEAIEKIAKSKTRLGGNAEQEQ